MKTLLFACLGMLSFGAAAESAAITDAQIAAIVVTANQVDIDAGKLACETFAVVPGQER
jgi:putative membrane protein